MGRLRLSKLREQQWHALCVHRESPLNIEPDDTYIRLIYDRLGEHVEVEIPLPGREAQP